MAKILKLKQCLAEFGCPDKIKLDQRWKIMMAQHNFAQTANIGPTYILQDIASTLGQHLFDVRPTVHFGHNCQYV